MIVIWRAAAEIDDQDPGIMSDSGHRRLLAPQSCGTSDFPVLPGEPDSRDEQQSVLLMTLLLGHRRCVGDISRAMLFCQRFTRDGLALTPRQKIMVELTLARRHSPLADPLEQLRILEDRAGAASFEQTLSAHGISALQATAFEVLQINVGRLCNQTCRHCHVDAGPDRREVMTRQVMEQCLDVLSRSTIPAESCIIVPIPSP